MNVWFTFLEQPLVNGLIAFYHLFGNLGWAIFSLTVAIRFVLIPLTLPSMKASNKMKELAPKIAKLKEKYKGDKQGFAKAQMELYRQSGVNPAAGCLPQIIQIVILIALFQAFQQVLKSDGSAAIETLNRALYPFLQLPQDASLNLRFLYLDLTKPDLIKISGLPSLPGFFLLFSAIFQFLSSKWMMPTVNKEKELAKKTPGVADDFATAFQSQSLYLFPLMTIFIGLKFASGLAIYWFTFSLFNVVQQIIIQKPAFLKAFGRKND